jgi:hypothetical protein
MLFQDAKKKVSIFQRQPNHMAIKPFVPIIKLTMWNQPIGPGQPNSYLACTKIKDRRK